MTQNVSQENCLLSRFLLVCSTCREKGSNSDKEIGILKYNPLYQKYHVNCEKETFKRVFVDQQKVINTKGLLILHVHRNDPSSAGFLNA